MYIQKMVIDMIVSSIGHLTQFFFCLPSYTIFVFQNTLQYGFLLEAIWKSKKQNSRCFKKKQRNRTPDKLFYIFLVHCTVIMHNKKICIYSSNERKKESYQMIYTETNIRATILGFSIFMYQINDISYEVSEVFYMEPEL